MKNKLTKLIETQKICCIYTNVDNLDRFNVGYILLCDDKYFIVESIGLYGKKDGISCGIIDDIIKIESGDEYCKNIEQLFIYHKEKRYPKLNFKDNLLNNMISYIKENEAICTIELCDSNNYDAIGFVSNFDSDVIDIEAISQNGKSDGETRVNIISISRLRCDSDDEQKLEILHKLNK